ncbi:hypothetical protein ABFS82_14G261400 [Erythranthe guttata]|uniref:BHLH domain-containing protein n=1 Tax=Erythranthe guttata TaxID=4155 RepID=A0A022R8Q5_ERYGU|nr:PREDICTED: transcription factor bHLH139-like [Erythranthe guttata]EYU36374.1 hypothetical protein MIMGU_mgv1a025380mg [Erythranthe guttata]|eukprot:XP_012838212.1 PREDICTED: transcription factor bHLH139-like [Erythranthe guttata]
MESIGAFLDQEWESLSKMFSFEEDSDFLNSCSSLFGELPSSDFLSGDGNLSVLPSDVHHGTNNLDINDANYFYYVSQESVVSQSESNEIINHFEMSPSMDFVATMNDSSASMVGPVFTDDDVMQEFRQLKADILNEQLCVNNADNSSCKRKFETELLPQDISPKKKPRISRNAHKKTRNGPQSTKKNKKAICIDDEEVNIIKGGENNGQSSSTCTSEEDDSNVGAISESKKSASNGKAKVGKGTATDPQSLYARKRREKINERLRILQNLVPNGTKVDISTMLEEAVQYVKFLQLQIKLLSSDEMWMYAPIAYNGMDMGLYQRIN